MLRFLLLRKYFALMSENTSILLESAEKSIQPQPFAVYRIAVLELLA